MSADGADYVQTFLKCIFRSGTDLILLFMLFFFLFFLGWPSKKPKLKSDQDEIWQEYSSCKYALIDRVGFSVCCHKFNMAAMTSFHAEKCCHLVSEHEVCQSPIYTSLFIRKTSASSWFIVHLLCYSYGWQASYVRRWPSSYAISSSDYCNGLHPRLWCNSYEWW